jgi:hypothetical protein
VIAQVITFVAIADAGGAPPGIIVYGKGYNAESKAKRHPGKSGEHQLI